MEFALEVRNVSFPSRPQDDFPGFEPSPLQGGKALLIVGGSGSGKSLLPRFCAGLVYPGQGRVTLDGIDLQRAPKAEIQDLRAQIPEPMTTAQETTEDSNKLIQGLQNHWLLRGSMPGGKGAPSPAVGQRESPYEKSGETQR